MLVEFGPAGRWITSPANPGLSQVAGPLHNQIAQPNREINNTTIWQADYNREHYVDMYFNQMVEYYKSQSSGRYTFNGDVMHWVKVPFNEARYGRDSCGDIVCNNTWFLIRDAMAFWVKGQLDAVHDREELVVGERGVAVDDAAPPELLELLPGIDDALGAQAIDEIEGTPCPLIVRMLLVRSENQARHCPRIPVTPRPDVAGIAAEPVQELLAHDARDSREATERLFQHVKNGE